MNVTKLVWYDRNFYTPVHGRRIVVRGVPSGMLGTVEMHLFYHEKAGLIENVTEWAYTDMDEGLS